MTTIRRGARVELIDLRSDTVTQPTPEMRHAMANAELGDDVYGEDPTVNRLEERAAQMLGTEAAMLVISGTMGNRIGLLVNVPRGHAVLADSLSHAFLYEAGGAAMVGVMSRSNPFCHQLAMRRV